MAAAQSWGGRGASLAARARAQRQDRRKCRAGRRFCEAAHRQARGASQALSRVCRIDVVHWEDGRGRVLCLAAECVRRSCSGVQLFERPKFYEHCSDVSGPCNTGRLDTQRRSSKWSNPHGRVLADTPTGHDLQCKPLKERYIGRSLRENENLGYRRPLPGSLP